MGLDTGARVDVAGSIFGMRLPKVDLSVLATVGGTITSVEISPLKETVKAVILNGALFGYGLYEETEFFGPDCRAIDCDVDTDFVSSRLSVPLMTQMTCLGMVLALSMKS